MKPAIVAVLVALATGCASTAQPAEPVTLPIAPPPGPWTITRNALVGCATDHGLSGDLRTRVEIGQDGIVMSVQSGYGESYAHCVGTAMMHTRFGAQRGRVFDLSFNVQPPGVPAFHEATVSSPACREDCN